jgi:hypothetical protein
MDPTSLSSLAVGVLSVGSTPRVEASSSDLVSNDTLIVTSTPTFLHFCEVEILFDPFAVHLDVCSISVECPNVLVLYKMVSSIAVDLFAVKIVESCETLAPFQQTTIDLPGHGEVLSSLNLDILCDLVGLRLLVVVVAVVLLESFAVALDLDPQSGRRRNDRHT